MISNKYMQLLSAALGCLLIVGISSCSKDRDNTPAHENKDTLSSKPVRERPFLSVESKKNGPKEDKKKFAAGLLPPEEMNMFLPAKIHGFEKYPYSGGYSSDGVNEWSTVSTEYVYNKKAFLSFAIFDYGVGGYIHNKKYLKELPRESGMESKWVENKYGKGVSLWNAREGTGKLHFFIWDRYEIRIIADGIPADFVLPERLLSLINIDKLIAAGEKY